ncbi:hypothetical protein [Botrimarina sp.]|uniref:hypothetical protein n=1 Tax=Botrimarina sp. TaxID=2795802 RepID=UPI0032EF464F
MTTEEILAAARAAKKPAADESAQSGSAADSQPEEPTGPRGRRMLTAKDILAIANGQMTLRREQPVCGQPLADKRLPDPGDAKPEALPEPLEKKKLTAADIRDLGQRS